MSRFSDYNSFVDTVRSEMRSFGSLPFWSWNDRLEPKELRRQIGVMDEIGIHGFFMHARGGLETEYLSDEWFDCVNACVDEAKKRGMEAWSYDENGWPSGFAGGALLKDEDNLARYIIGHIEDVFPSGDNVLSVSKIENGICRPASAEDAPPFCVVRTYADPSYVDTLRADITAKFIEATHAEYKKHVGADFGGAMPGFFTDEPQYYRYHTPYSRILPDAFRTRFGYEVTDALPALFWDFEGDTAYRYDYYLLLHDLFTNHFIRPIYEWCEENGCQVTGHGIAEDSLDGQMMCCGGVMEFYRYQHVPGIDFLGLGLGGDLAYKQLGSVCAQLGRKRALSEMFAACGWDVSPRDLKRIADIQYAGGVTVMCQHLYPYSERGQRKRDYPAHYSEHNPWQSHLVTMERHYAALGRLLAEGSEYAPILVVHPMRDMYRLYKRHDLSLARPLEQKVWSMVQFLGDNQVPYHFGDENMMAEMAVIGDGTLTLGECTYRVIIVPPMTTLSSGTVALLREFRARGGRIHFWNGAIPTETDGRPADLSDLSSDITLAEICSFSAVQNRIADTAPQGIRQRIRIAEDGRRIIYTTNLAEEPLCGIRTTVRGCRGLRILTPETMESSLPAGTRLADGSVEVMYDLPVAASIVFIEDDCDPVPAGESCRTADITLPDEFRLCGKVENILTLDHVCMSKDGVSYTELRPLERVRDELLREDYCGKLYLRYSFTVLDVPQDASLLWENPRVTRITLNGREITANGFQAPDRAFSRGEAASAMVPGKNDVILEMDYAQSPQVHQVIFGNLMESMRNCLNIDSEIENVYVVGDFRVKTERDRFTKDDQNCWLYDGGFAIEAQRGTVDLRDPVRDGFPFFGGVLDAVCEIRGGEAAFLRPVGRCAVVEAWVNDVYCGKRFFEDGIDLRPYLPAEGKAVLRLRLTNGLRNVVGPFHNNVSECNFVGPNAFSYEKKWVDGRCDEYYDRYSFVHFGI